MGEKVSRRKTFVALYERAYEDARAWDRATQRNYDRRWVSLHSIKAFLGDERTTLDYLDEPRLEEVQSDMEKTEAWDSVLKKWIKEA